MSILRRLGGALLGAALPVAAGILVAARILTRWQGD